jgi:hypothetical protein
MSSRALAAARSRRAGDNNPPPISGNRPITSINSQAAFVGNQSLPNNVRVARSMQQQGGQRPPRPPPQHPSQSQMSNNENSNALPFSKLSISDAIGLITLRLGRVEQLIIDTDNEEKPEALGGEHIPENHKLVDNSVITSMVNRIDALEKNKGENVNITELSAQFKRMCEDVNKHTIELAKCTEQVFRFNRELTETKDLLKSFMVKYDLFAEETTQNFTDYENALTDLEKRLENNSVLEELVENNESVRVTNEDKVANYDAEPKSFEEQQIDVEDLKNMVKQELYIG